MTPIAHIHAAQMMQLAQHGVIDAASEAVLLRAIDSALAGVEPGDSIVDTIASYEERAAGQIPQEIAGALTLGLFRAEVAAGALRMRYREAAMEIAEVALDLRASLILLADAHTATVMPAYVDHRLASPTTLAHYLGGMIVPLAAAQHDLVTATGRIDRSPLGSAMMAGDVFSVDRGLIASALGFRDPIPHTVQALDATVAPLARWLNDLLLWMRTDPQSFFVDERWLSLPEPGHPALEIPLRVEALARRLERVGREARGAVETLRCSPYGPLGSSITVLDEAVAGVLTESCAALTETSAFVNAALIVNRAWLANRAGREYSTAGDLAPFLMQEEGLSPTAARQIAALTVSRLRELNLEASAVTPDLIDGAALMVIGRELKVEMETLGRYLAPRRYLERRDVLGSPSAERTRAWLADERAAVDADRSVVSAMRERWGAAASAIEASFSAEE